jgi:pimeloyl-ACP methyl ester carboxylesterase
MLMSNDTHETARKQLVQVGDVEFAYRRFGRRGSLPLLFLNYFAANMDNWDPKMTNAFAAEREVILLDNAGVGGSSGETPSTVAAMTTDCVEFCRALDLRNIDVVGFSLGGISRSNLRSNIPT